VVTYPGCPLSILARLRNRPDQHGPTRAGVGPAGLPGRLIGGEGGRAGSHEVGRGAGPDVDQPNGRGTEQPVAPRAGRGGGGGGGVWGRTGRQADDAHLDLRRREELCEFRHK
jgi:hypothetical protein